MSALCCRGLAVGYHQKALIEKIDLNFMAGQMTCILGPNGSGKTTLLKTMAGLLPPVQGQVLVNGQLLNEIPRKSLARRLAVVLTTKPMLNGMTGRETVMMGRYPHTGFFGTLSARDLEIVDHCMRQCQAEHLMDVDFQKMSDGERQKILLARGLAQQPDFILLDEPTNHLDIHHKLEVLAMLRNICSQEGKTVICTLHEPELALKCADILVLTGAGRIIQQGAAAEVIADGQLERLYGLRRGQLEGYSGIVEFTAAKSRDVFLLGSNAHTLPLLRKLHQAGRGFALAQVAEHDICCYVARAMGAPVYLYGDEKKALEALAQYKQVIIAAGQKSSLLAEAAEKKIKYDAQ